MIALAGLASQGAVLGLSAAAQPGPFQGYLVAQSLRNGAARTLPLAFVPLLSDPPVVVAVLVLLNQVPDDLLRWLHLAGGAVVLWLGAGALRAAFSPPPSAAAAPPARGILRATLVNLTNPNVWIAWSAVCGPILTAAWRASPAHALVFLAAFYLLLAGGNVALVVLAGRAAAAGPRLARALGLLSGLALVGFGLWQVGRGAFGG